MGTKGTLTALFLILSSGALYAAPAALTYQGRIVKSNGQPLEHSAVAFEFTILAPNKTCVLYREQLNNVNMLNSGGVFDVKIGSAHSYPGGANPGFTILDAFNNGSPLICDGNSPFNPGLTDGRYLRVRFYDGSQWNTISPDNEIRTVPFSGFAASAAKLGAHVASDFVKKNEVNGNLNCNSGSFLTWDAINKEFGCAAVAGASGGTVTSVTSANGYLTVSGDNTVAPVLTVNVGTTAGTVAAGNDARFSDSRAPSGPAGGVLTGTYPNPGLGDGSVSGNKIAAGAVSTDKMFANPGINRLVMTDSSTGATLAPLSCAADQVLKWSVATGWTCVNQTSLAVGSATQATNFLGSLAGDVSGTQGVTVVDRIKGYELDFSAAPVNGQVLKFSAGKWVASNDSNTGGTVTNVSATAPLSVSNGGTTPQISIAKADSTTDGYLAASDWIVFSGKQNALGFTPLNPANNLSELTASAATARSNLGLGTAAVRNAPAAGDAAAAEVVLGNDSRLTNSRAPSGAASGDLAGTYPGPTLVEIGVGGTGTKITYDTKGRVTGSTGLAAGDIPNLDWAKITTGKPTNLAGYGITDAILNGGGTPGIQSGDDADKPATPAAGTIYFAKDSKVIYQFNSGAWVAIASSAGAGGTISSLNGDVVASGNGAVTASIATGAVTSAKILDGTIVNDDISASAAIVDSKLATISTAGKVANSATSGTAAATINTLVLRDGSAGFAANAVSVSSQVYRDSGSNTVTVQAPANVTSSYTLRWPAAVGALNQLLKTDASGNLSWSGLGLADIKATIAPFGGVFDSAACSASQTLTYQSATDTFICQAISVTAAMLPKTGSDGAYVNGGNSFGQTAILGTADAQNLSIQTNGSARMTVLSGGNIGIGTAAPVMPLDISGTTDNMLRLSSNGTGGTRLLMANSSAGGKTWQFVSSGSGSAGGAGHMVLADYSTMPSGQFVFKTDGTFGAGTTSPAAFAHFKKDQNATTELRVDNSMAAGNTSAGAAIQLVGTGVGGTIGVYPADYTTASFQDRLVVASNSSAANGLALRTNTTAPIDFATNNAVTPHMRVASGGNIGINNLSPQTMLHFTGKDDSWASSFRMDRSWESTVDYFQMMYDYQGLKIRTMADDADEAHIIFKPLDSEAVRITESGSVGINTSTPSEKLEVNGNVKAAAYLYTSDVRLKKDVVTLPQALEKALQLRGVNFVWRDSEEKTVGFIAQEVEAVYPELVRTDARSGYKSVQYGNIVAILVEALKEEHAQRIQAQRGLASVDTAAQSRIDKLEKENHELKARLERLEQTLLGGK